MGFATSKGEDIAHPPLAVDKTVWRPQHFDYPEVMRPRATRWAQPLSVRIMRESGRLASDLMREHPGIRKIPRLHRVIEQLKANLPTSFSGKRQ